MLEPETTENVGAFPHGKRTEKCEKETAGLHLGEIRLETCESSVTKPCQSVVNEEARPRTSLQLEAEGSTCDRRAVGHVGSASSFQASHCYSVQTEA